MGDACRRESLVPKESYLQDRHLSKCSRLLPTAHVNLKSMCWKAPRLEDRRSLSSAIYNNRQHLRNLELDLIDWQKLRSKRAVSPSSSQDGDKDENCRGFLAEILEPSSIPVRHLLPVLQDLSISGIPIGGGLANVVQIKNLRLIRLRRCDGWRKYLQYIMDKKMEVKLKTFEIQDSSDSFTSAENHVLGRFLRSFRGLEKLFVCLSGISSNDPSF